MRPAPAPGLSEQGVFRRCLNPGRRRRDCPCAYVLQPRLAGAPSRHRAARRTSGRGPAPNAANLRALVALRLNFDEPSALRARSRNRSPTALRGWPSPRSGGRCLAPGPQPGASRHPEMALQHLLRFEALALRGNWREQVGDWQAMLVAGLAPRVRHSDRGRGGGGPTTVVNGAHAALGGGHHFALPLRPGLRAARLLLSGCVCMPASSPKSIRPLDRRSLPGQAYADPGRAPANPYASRDLFRNRLVPSASLIRQYGQSLYALNQMLLLGLRPGGTSARRPAPRRGVQRGHDPRAERASTSSSGSRDPSRNI